MYVCHLLLRFINLVTNGSYLTSCLLPRIQNDSKIQTHFHMKKQILVVKQSQELVQMANSVLHFQMNPMKAGAWPAEISLNIITL